MEMGMNREGRRVRDESGCCEGTSDSEMPLSALISARCNRSSPFSQSP
jgi:hypothetical protein